MQSLSIWHWIVIAILIVLVVAAIWLFARAINQRRPDDRSVKESSSTGSVSGPSGFQGWLFLVAIGVFVSPLVTIYLMSQVENGADDAMLQRLRLLFIAEFVLYGVVLALQICTAFFMARRSRRFVTFYIIAAIAAILLQPGDIILAVAWVSAQRGQAFQPILQASVTPEDIRRWVSTGIGVGIWMLYVIRSRRVANTFVR